MEGLKTYRAFLNETTDIVVRYGGSFSGEHGDGQSRAEFLQRMFGPELIEAFREFKSIWDPSWKMNPGATKKNGNSNSLKTPTPVLASHRYSIQTVEA